MLSFTWSFSSRFCCWATWDLFFTPLMASLTSTPLFQQPGSVRWILFETLTGFWYAVSNDGGFLLAHLWLLSSTFWTTLQLAGVDLSCLGDGQLQWVSPLSGIVQCCAFLRFGSGGPLPLPLPNLGLAGSLRGFTSLRIIMGFFPHELFCLQSKCWFTALSFPGLALAVVAFCSVHCCQ
jgi:hypothetical protein